MTCKFTTAILTLCIATSYVSKTCASEEEFPESLIGFIKPGMHVGLHMREGSSAIRIEIFDSKDFVIAQDSRELGLQELAEKYSAVARQIQQIREKAQSESGDKQRDYNVIQTGGDRNIQFCKVVHVGADYISLSYGHDDSKKQVVAIRYVTTVSWNSGLTLFTRTGNGDRVYCTPNRVWIQSSVRGRSR